MWRDVFFDQRKFTIEVDDGDIWWWGSEVCEILGGAHPRRNIGRLMDDERRTSLRGSRQNTQVNMSGLFRLICGSKSDSANDFRKWLIRDVREMSVREKLRSPEKIEITSGDSLRPSERLPKVVTSCTRQRSEDSPKRKVGRPKGRASLEKERDQLKGRQGDHDIERSTILCEIDRELARLPEGQPLTLESGCDYSEEELDREWDKIHDEMMLYKDELLVLVARGKRSQLSDEEKDRGRTLQGLVKDYESKKLAITKMIMEIQERRNT